MMTKDQATTLAEFVNRMRPDWDVAGIVANLGKVKHLNVWEVAHALLRLAENPKVDSPGALATKGGEHWRERSRTAAGNFPPKRDQECRLHPGQWSDNCGGCRTDDLAAVYEDEQSAKVQLGRPGDSTAGVAACRASLSGRAGE